ncbi:carboxymuconolactone decarboxylase family protein [Pseudonocardia ailaonensis]|uniref:Carboxymuconolactone decarboxylase family protein n=1 Tax=Pseudonocardia ailaonensis TaxID=367279 RepID=A0ABN2NJ55_9PSEU
MDPRMKNPALAVPGALDALLALAGAVAATGISRTTLELVNLRASQINGCGVCLHMHARDLRKAGESDERIDTVAGWRDSPWFTDEERAALALTEELTRAADRGNPVSDEVFEEAAAHYDEQQLGALFLGIAQINVWNRLNAGTHQVAGAF